MKIASVSMASNMMSFVVIIATMLLGTLLAVASPDDKPADPLMGLVSSLVGGDWIMEASTPDGGVFRSRNHLEKGPDGYSVVGTGWLGDASGMVPHSATLIYRLPDSEEGGVGFVSVDETGAIARGRLSLKDQNTINWDWPTTSLDGKVTTFSIDMVFDGPDAYSMLMSQVAEDGTLTPWPPLKFRRVKEIPEGFGLRK